MRLLLPVALVALPLVLAGCGAGGTASANVAEQVIRDDWEGGFASNDAPLAGRPDLKGYHSLAVDCATPKARSSRCRLTARKPGAPDKTLDVVVTFDADGVVRDWRFVQVKR